MGTDTSTKSPDTPVIKPLADNDPDREAFQARDERDLTGPLEEATPEEGDQQADNATETQGAQEASEPEIPVDDGNSDRKESEIDLNSDGQGPRVQQESEHQRGDKSCH